jgi:hypothetical protein
MRVVVVAVAVLACVAVARADNKGLAPYAGNVVISPDAPPATVAELPGYLKANLSPDGKYEVLHGPPWPFHLVAVLARPAASVRLEITDPADPKAAPLLSAPFSLPGDKKLLLAEATPTIAAGFAANHTYLVRILTGKKLVAKAELRLRD